MRRGGIDTLQLRVERTLEGRYYANVSGRAHGGRVGNSGRYPHGCRTGIGAVVRAYRDLLRKDRAL
jgi:hypothetical protein